jgi:hypothetical protein
VSVLLGNGDGTFQAARNFAAGIRPYSVAVGDFNGDGTPDLAVANDTFSGTVSVLLGNGDGTFQAARNFAAGSYPYSVAVGDFTGDGTLDLAVANDTFSGTVSVLLGNGDGTFQAARNYAAGARPKSVAVGDFNGDGTLDLAVANINDIPLPHLLARMAHPLVNEPLVNSLAGTGRGEAVAKDVEASKHLPLAAGKRSLKVVVGFVLGERPGSWPHRTGLHGRHPALVRSFPDGRPSRIDCDSRE